MATAGRNAGRTAGKNAGKTAGKSAGKAAVKGTTKAAAKAIKKATAKSATKLAANKAAATQATTKSGTKAVKKAATKLIKKAATKTAAKVVKNSAASSNSHSKKTQAQTRLKKVRKGDFPVHEARRYLEPGPIVLVSSHHDGKNNIMTMGWHCILEFSPSLFGCLISSGNHSHEMIRKSGECVINLPTTALTDIVARIGNCTGSSVDKFAEFGLTAGSAEKVSAALIEECHASFECRLYDDVLVDKYNYFIFEIVKAHVARRPTHPETLHYTGDGVFMVAGKIIDRRRLFTKVS